MRLATSLLALCAMACGGTNTSGLSAAPATTPVTQPGSGTTAPPVVPALGEPIAGLTADENGRFEDGRNDFIEEESPATGLGPVFNERSCVACHLAPGGAVGGTNDRLVTRFGRRENGVFDALASLGGSLVQDHAIDGFSPEQVPPQANVVIHRRTTSLFGLGLLEAVPDAAILALAQSQRADVAGTVSRVTDLVSGKTVVGRFGWKAQVPTLLQFAGDAYLNEIGITNPLFPNESCPQGDCSLLAQNPKPELNDDGSGLASAADFMAMLAPPAPGPRGPREVRGESLARAVGCLDCHVQTLVTGSSPIAALAHQPVHAYTDLLLHDMGALGDGIEQGSATGTQMRTAPLWGLRNERRFLHDGRAATLDEAIRAHDGQARRARDAYTRLDDPSRDALVAFLRSL